MDKKMVTLLCGVINRYSEFGQHPPARKDNLHYFRIPAIVDCARRALDDDKLTGEGRTLLEEWLRDNM